MKYSSGAVYKGSWAKIRNVEPARSRKSTVIGPFKLFTTMANGCQGSKMILPVNEGPPLKRPCTNGAHSSAKAKSNDKENTMLSPVSKAVGVKLEEEPSTQPDADPNTHEEQKDDEEARSAKARSDHNTAGMLSHVSEAEGVNLEEESPTQSAADPDTHDDEIDGDGEDESSCSSTKGYYKDLCDRLLAKISVLTVKVSAQRAEIKSLKQDLANGKREHQDMRDHVAC
ncbi:hypothetical protein ACHAXR_003746 [Thalassiosira sp. AJA248-18]